MTEGRADPRPIIASLRDGRGLDATGATLIAKGLASGVLTDAQAAAFAMAAVTRGLGEGGRTALTMAMRDSGRVMSWDLSGPVVDKHSTGGVGDVVSLVLAPILAACGCHVPMISGRGLGHTGGTLDKLEAIPGFTCDLPEDRFRQIVGSVGCAIVSASPDLAPADRRLYAIRDETATVESVDLITASILSKKLAAGLDALVLDVKCGSGAFMTDLDDARDLARALVDTAVRAGCKTRARITDMDQPLADAAGNALEVRAAIATLKGAPGRLRDLSLGLAADCLELAGVDDGHARATAALDSGRATEVLARMVAAQGGPSNLIEDTDKTLPSAAVVQPVPAPVAGIIEVVDTTALGRVVVGLGGGRLKAGEPIDPSVGLTDFARPGDALRVGEPLCIVHARNEESAAHAVQLIRAAYTIGDTPPPPRPLIIERIG